MKSTVVVMFYSFVYVIYSTVYVNAQVKTFDPQSLYQHFKNLRRSAHQMDGKADVAEELPLGLSYFTPITEKLMNNGTISRDAVLDVYKDFTDDQKQKLSNVESQLRACWSETKEQSQSSQKTYESCYFFYPLDQFCQDTYPYESVAKGETQMKLVSCLGQKVSGISEMLGESFGRSKKSTESNNHGLSIEFGGGFAFGLYVSGSTGLAYGLSDPSNNLVLATYCFGFKLDISAGGGVSVSYFFDMDDIPGEAVTVELGLDVPLTEIGIDVLLHFNHEAQEFIGFGLSFGVGVGLNSVDIASSVCRTSVLAQYRSIVLIAIGWVRGWTCSRYLLGVISEDRYICCPEDNPGEDCTGTGFCWFDRRECPHTPKQLAKIKGSAGLAFVILRATCPGQTYVPEGRNNLQKCQELWKKDWRQKYLLWKIEPQECWFSDTYSIDTCAWAPFSSGSMVWFRP